MNANSAKHKVLENLAIPGKNILAQGVTEEKTIDSKFSAKKLLSQKKTQEKNQSWLTGKKNLLI